MIGVALGAIQERIRPTLRTLLIFWTFGGTVLLGTWAVHHYGHKDFADLTRDPVSIMRASITTGMLSTIGGLGWAATLGVCLLGAWAARGSPATTPSSRFFFWSGLFTAWLMCDDVFLFHEHVFPIYFHIRELWVEAVYPVFCLIWLLAFARTILKTNWLLLGLALSCLALSEFMDAILHDDRDLNFLIEDGFKFLGIVTWFAYFVVTTSSALRGRIGRAEPA